MGSTIETNSSLESKIRRMESYLKADPENPLLLLNLGDLYHQNGQYEMALASYDRCLSFDLNNTIARGRRANVLISLHSFEKAEKSILWILERTGEDPALLHNLGLTLFYQHRFEEAHQAFQRAREAGLGLHKNLAYMVYSLHKNDDTEEALKIAETWLQEAPGPETEGYVAIIEMDHGAMDEARKRAEKVLAQQPGNPDANVVLGNWQLERQDVERAISHFRQVVENEPDNPRGWQGLGLAYMYQQESSKAIEALEKAAALMPDHATNHLIIGWAKLAAQDALGAEKAFRRAIAVDRNFGEAHGGLASALVFQNRLEEARTEIKQAMGLEPNGFGAVFAQAVSMQLQGKGNQGTKLIAKMLQQPPVPRSKPLIEHIQDYLRTQGAASTPIKK